MDQHAPSFEQLVMAINELSQQLNNVKNNTVLKEDFTTLTNQLNTFAQQVTEIQSNHAEAIQINAEATRNNTEAIQVNTNRIVTIGREAQNACNILLAKQIELNEQLSAAKRRLSEFEGKQTKINNTVSYTMTTIGARESREARSRAARQATKFFED
jgi:hypothetical protein